MKYIRLCFLAVICSIFFLVPLTSAHAYAQPSPQRIAILPVQFMVASDARGDIARLVADPVNKKFYHALNNFTKKYEYLSTSDIKQELPDLYVYPYLSDNELKNLADRLGADIMLAPIIARCIDHQTYYLEEVLQETYVEVHLIGYERSQDHIIRLADREQYWGIYGTPFTAAPLTRDLMGRLIPKLEDSVPAPLINK
jgi:hypothetical protein